MERAAEEAAFNEFVVARSSALMRTAYLLTQDHQLAEDLVQTALFKAALRWQRITGDPEPYVQADPVHREHLLVAPSQPAGGRVGTGVRRAGPVSVSTSTCTWHIERALQRLTPRQRAVLVLRYYEDLTEVEAARVLGVRVGTVKSMHRQALARLRAAAPDLGELMGVDHD